MRTNRRTRYERRTRSGHAEAHVWQVVATFTVDDTPDPAYDVNDHEAMADELHATIEAALQPDLANFAIDTLQCVDD